MPPQTPNSILLSSASARHSYRTGQPRQIRFATFCSAPWTNNASGSPFRQAAMLGQSTTMVIFHVPPCAVPHDSAGTPAPLASGGPQPLDPAPAANRVVRTEHTYPSITGEIASAPPSHHAL